MYIQDRGATWRPTLPICIFNGILYTHKNTLLFERSKYTLMST